ncbi:4285_t:CDS:2, partial [Ambispora leptoticha]
MPKNKRIHLFKTTTSNKNDDSISNTINKKLTTDKVIHPSSRKAIQLQRALLRVERLQKTKARNNNKNYTVNRVLWFRDVLIERESATLPPSSIECFTKSEIYELIEKSTREEMLLAIKEKERKEFKDGI